MTHNSVLITGATGALGLGVTQRFLRGGAQVTGTYVSEAEAHALEAACTADERTRLTLVRVDVTNEAEVHALFESLPRLTALVHLVGGFTMGPTSTLELAAFEAHHRLVLHTTFLCCKHALRTMRDRGHGRIVTIGSRAALEPSGQLAAYASAKAAVVALTRVLADETKGTDITANCVLPSVIDTPANRAAMGEDEADDWVPVSHLAETIWFLTSPAAGSLRGAALPVYGSM